MTAVFEAGLRTFGAVLQPVLCLVPAFPRLWQDPASWRVI